MDAASGISNLANQIMWNRLLAVVEEQAQSLIRTAFSPIVRECGDVSAGVFDLRGRMLAQAVTGTPGHVNSMARSVSHFIAAFPIATMKPGDAYITNDPWKGTGHRHDFVVTTPVFHRGQLVALFSCTSHLTDIGGIGFGPDGTDVHMEGLAIPFLKLFDEGRLNETLMAMIKENSRLPVDVEGDVYSLANCNEVGARRLREMCEEFDLDSLEDLAETIISASREAVTARIAALPKGTYGYAMTVDGYEEAVDLVATVTIGERTVEVDLTGSSPASGRGINVPLAYTAAYCSFALASAIAPEVPNNAGSLEPYVITAPGGTVVNALPPSPVSSRHIIGQMMPDVVFGCLAQAIPDRVPAEGTSSVWNIMLRGKGNARTEAFSTTILTNGGTGARPGKDGLSGTAYPSGLKGSPIETVEVVAPVIFWKKEFRPNSGGAGRWRGGHGLELEIENVSKGPIELLAAFDRLAHPARGRDGGRDGQPGTVHLKGSGRRMLGKGLQPVPEGETLVIRTPGGGGIGSPAEREAGTVQRDIAFGVLDEDGAAAYRIAETGSPARA